MSKKEFITKLILWLLFAGGVPVYTIARKYQLFSNHQSELQFSGWGIIVIIIITLLVIVSACYILKRIKWSMEKQIIVNTAFIVFPLFMMFTACNIIANNIENIKYILIVSMISEFVSGFFNPLPKYIYLKNVEDIKEIVK